MTAAVEVCAFCRGTPLTVARDLAVPLTLDIPQLQVQLGEEIAQLELALALRLRLQRAFDQYLAKP